ncbi:MAG: electron transfer flavoprotein subunit beta [Deltaproteobacteria bacterium CG11_big_fil_rev_8_21_14_0_20_49_13]|nr:MAG: electron transfer flavoprotein subunit beta [Deltaproteobacteria bacterium CG11_big_fil_rev_8_21_14_0_20_49_13]
MKIGVLLKQVPDTETKIKLKPDNSGFEENDVKWVINPYDEYAVEEALKLKEKVAGSEVVLVTAGPARAIDSMRQALAMGADRGIRIDTTGASTDLYGVALILSKVIEEEKFDIVFAGKQAVDDDCAAVVQYCAEITGLPHASPIEAFTLGADNKGATVQRPVAGGMKEMIEIEFPCILGCEKGLNSPRYASLPGIMKAKTKPIVEKKAADLLGGEAIRVSVAGWSLPPERAAGKKVDGEPEVAAEQLVKFLREEAKVI